MSNLIKAPRGMFDILPEDMPLWHRLEGAARDAFRRYGYGEIRPPILEETRLFVRGIGDTTDIVEMEMYTFEGKGRDESLTLRPEATAGVVRAYVEHSFHKTAPMQKFAYIGPMFRYERPQAGRQRMFHQAGVEVLGTYAPEADVETIALALAILRGAGLTGMRLKINSIGCPKCRPQYRATISRFLGDRIDKLCPDCKRRYERNVFRVLDCKEESCRAVISEIPGVEIYLDRECREHFAAVKYMLGELGVEYCQDKLLVRGLDYYTRTVYEIAHSSLGARDAVGGGGRYDNLVEDLGGPATGAVGFALGMEATLLAMKNSGSANASEARPLDVFVVVVGPGSAMDYRVRVEALKLLQSLRQVGLAAEMSFEEHKIDFVFETTETATDGEEHLVGRRAVQWPIKSVKAQMREANRKAARTVIVLGPDELQSGQIKVKDMMNGSESVQHLQSVGSFIRQLLAK
jgi:histidyl-tRNA synthetase